MYFYEFESSSGVFLSTKEPFWVVIADLESSRVLWGARSQFDPTPGHHFGTEFGSKIAKKYMQIYTNKSIGFCKRFGAENYHKIVPRSVENLDSER